MKKGIIGILVILSGLLFPSAAPAQNLPAMTSMADVRHTVLPDGLECFVAANPYVSAFADFALVRRTDGRVLEKLENVVVLREEKLDSTLARLMKLVAEDGNPADLALIACGDINGEDVTRKLKYMSYMVPAGVPSQRRLPETVGLTPVTITEEDALNPGMKTIRAEWTSPRTPDDLAGTIQRAVYDKTVYEFGQAACDRVKAILRKADIPYADVRFRHVGSLRTFGDERFSLETVVEAENSAAADDAVRTALSELDADGASATELLLLEKRYFRYLTRRAEQYERSNVSYMDRCALAALFGVPTASSSEILDFHRSKDMTPQVREKVFAGIVSALVDMPSAGAGTERTVKVPAALSDTLAFPGPGSKVSLKSSRKDHLSGGQVWTFSNGFKVVYRKMPVDGGRLYYSLAMNGGFGAVTDLSQGEGAFMSDYMDWCYVAGMKSDTFRNVLGLADISLDVSVNLSNIMISGSAADDNVPLLMKSLLAFVNERSIDEKEFSYYMSSEQLRLRNQGMGVGTIRSVIDSLMCPGYRYSVYKKPGHLSEKTVTRTHALFEDMASRMNDGVLVLVGDMDESRLRKLITPYIGGFRTRNVAFSRPSVHYQPVSGWITYNAEGSRDAVVVAMSTRLSMTTDNMIVAEMASMALKDLLVRNFAGEGLRFNVYHSCRIVPEDRFSVMLTVEGEDGKDVPEDFLWKLREVLNDADRSAMDSEYLAACKAFLKKQWDINSTNPHYWLHVMAMRHLDGKDFTTGYAGKIDAVTQEKMNAVLSLLKEGSKIEYVIKRK